jgi:hypothetical protein
MFLQIKRLPMSNFNVKDEVADLKRQTSTIRKRSYRTRKSRLDKHTYELLELRKHGASVAEIQRWLRKQRVKVAHSTVLRWFEKHG